MIKSKKIKDKLNCAKLARRVKRISCEIHVRLRQRLLLRGDADLEARAPSTDCDMVCHARSIRKGGGILSRKSADQVRRRENPYDYPRKRT